MFNSPFSKFPLLAGLIVLPLCAFAAMPKGAQEQKNEKSSAYLGKAPAPKPQSDEEAFLIRRISSFWQDGDFRMVKRQIVDFFDKYPESELKEYFLAILGDLYLSENAPEKALSAYEQIKDKATVQNILINKLHCYYDLGNYEKIVAEAKPFANTSSKEFSDRKHEFSFLLAEGLFRSGLTLNDEDPYKKELYSQATPLYESLRETSYNEASLFALAEAYRFKKQLPEAIALYRELATRHSNEREDLLFQAATLEAVENPTRAIGTFSEVIDLKGKRQGDAEYNRLVLLFQTEQYSSVLSDYKKVLSHSSDEQHVMVSYIVGRSHFEQGHYQDANTFLTAFLEGPHTPNDQLKNALIMQMTCAKELVDADLLGRALSDFQTHFADDPEVARGLFMHGLMIKEKGDFSLAKEKLSFIKKTFPDFSKDPHFLYEYALLSHELSQWTDCYNAAGTFLMDEKNTELVSDMWKLLYSSALHRHDEEDPTYPLEAFYEDSIQVLALEDIFTSDELASYNVLLGKTLCDLGKFEQAHTHLENVLSLLSEEKQVTLAAEAHYLSAISLFQQETSPLEVCRHIEAAIALDPAAYERPTNHIHLYNHYLVAADAIGEVNASSAALIEKAAEHLFTALSGGAGEISDETALWLADHYFTKVAEYTNTHWNASLNDSEQLLSFASRAQGIYEKFLLEDGMLSTDPEKTVALESEVLKLAHLYDLLGKQSSRIAVVSSLLEQQSTDPLKPWGYKQHSLYELGKAYKAVGNPEKALETFSYISKDLETLPTTITQGAALEVASLRFKMIEPKLITEENETIVSVLTDLKELQIRKCALSEPVHLEAALTYVDVRSELASTQDKNAKTTFFLQRLVEDFQSQEDTAGKEYHLALEKTGQQKKLFDVYMTFIDGDLLRLEAERKKERNELAECEELCERSLEKFEKVKESQLTTKELHKRLNRSVEKVRSLTSF